MLRSLTTVAGSHTTRTLFVVAATAAAFIGLAAVAYSAYFSIAETLYRPQNSDSLASLQVVFFTAFALHLLGTVAAAGALTAIVRLPAYPTLAVTGVILAVLALFTLGSLTGLNYERFGVEFPLPGQANR